MKKIKSKFNFDDTFKKLKEKIEEKNLLVFHIADHRQNAIDSDLELEKTKVIFFGNPKVGTYLMEDNPEISYELPYTASNFYIKQGYRKDESYKGLNNQDVFVKILK